MNKKDIKSLLNKEDPLILEIGSNDGEDTAEFLQAFSNIKLYCFEPDVRAIRRFKQKIRDNRCTLFEFALGGIDGEIDFNQSSGNPGGSWLRYGDWDKSGSIKKPKNHLKSCPWCCFNIIRKIECRKLDSWADENGISFIDFIWADVQGAEEDLILGGINTLRERTKYLYTEYNNNEMYEGQINLNTLILLLQTFKIVKVFDNDVLLINKNLK